MQSYVVLIAPFILVTRERTRMQTGPFSYNEMQTVLTRVNTELRVFGGERRPEPVSPRLH